VKKKNCLFIEENACSSLSNDSSMWGIEASHLFIRKRRAALGEGKVSKGVQVKVKGLRDSKSS